jgi:hypothetical protein
MCVGIGYQILQFFNNYTHSLIHKVLYEFVGISRGGGGGGGWGAGGGREAVV